jgi:hypothetical protein
MTILKLHYDGWLKLPADLQRVLGAATGDLFEIVPTEDGLVLRMKAAAPALIEAAAISPTATAPAAPPAPASLPMVEPPAPPKRGRPRKAAADATAPKKVSPAASVALPPTLRAAGRRKPRTVQPPA